MRHDCFSRPPARLANSDFIVSVQVQDFWSAVTAGFIIQLLGVTYFIEKLRHAIGADRAAQAAVVPLVPEEAGGDGNAEGLADEMVRPTPPGHVLDDLAATGGGPLEPAGSGKASGEPAGAHDAQP